MRVAELIAALTAVQTTHGDVEVVLRDPSGGAFTRAVEGLAPVDVALDGNSIKGLFLARPVDMLDRLTKVARPLAEAAPRGVQIEVLFRR